MHICSCAYMYAWVQGKLRCMHRKVQLVCKYICAGENDLQEVITELYDISDVMHLGLALGIRMSTVEMIATDCHSSKKTLTTVIYHWLIRRDIVPQKQYEHPTWDVLATAVNCINHSLAVKIHHKYCC